MKNLFFKGLLFSLALFISANVVCADVTDNIPKINDEILRRALKKEIMKKFNITKQNISDWFKNTEKYNIVKNTTLKKVGSGPHTKLDEFEEDIILWFIVYTF